MEQIWDWLLEWRHPIVLQRNLWTQCAVEALMRPTSIVRMEHAMLFLCDWLRPFLSVRKLTAARTISQAVADINVLRQRAAYKSGESRPEVLVQWEPTGRSTGDLRKSRLPHIPLMAHAYTHLAVTEAVFTPGSPQALAEHYIPTVTTKAEICSSSFYLWRKVREFLSEGIAWEDQHNARHTIWSRWIPQPNGIRQKWLMAGGFNTVNGNGQNGKWKGQMKEAYTFRPWPAAYLLQLTDQEW